uniref:NADH-ubiquinone oxidoreductase chain 5 n=1 Tax=Schizocladia ischiensis TaxID=196139 RepID=A0A7S6ZPE4_9STRA|nr:Nad5 [Schizocladia ischiensis]QOW07608.1 Nad5 [Schizocladia ischiensis]
MYLNIVFLPLLGSIAAGLFGRFLGSQGAAVLTTTCVGLSLCLSGLAFYEVGLGSSPSYVHLLTWMESDFFHANWSLCFDSLTVVMLVVVTFISSLVHLYSTEYMGEDPHLPRFMSYLSLFTFFMLLLVTADNFLQMFVGWEGVGLCSYLLINFWFARLQANKAAIKAMLVNRVGDFGLALGIFAIFLSFDAVDYASVFAMAPLLSGSQICFLGMDFDALECISLLLFVGAVGKSAQVGLHTWLPDAMEGPTPVSALIHAATMVTAGVFLLARCSPLLEYAPKACFLICILGAMTAFFAATTGLVQNDLKRVIAYSTCSQLGYMVFACGLSNYSVAVFHLANHAFFKALLFLGAGSVIHAMGDEQDMRKMGGLRRLLPFTYAMMLVGSLSLMGMPFLTGFYSKDLILEVAYGSYTTGAHFAYALGTLAAFCTAFYSFRLIYLSFLSEANGRRPLLLGASESSWPISTALGILAIPSIFIGYLGKDLFIGLGTPFWGNAFFALPGHLSLVDAEFMPTAMKILPVCLSIVGAILAFVLYRDFPQTLVRWKLSPWGRKLYTFLNRKWFFDKFYNEGISQNFLDFGYHFTYKAIDRGFIEMLGPFGLSNLSLAQGARVVSWQTGMLYHYAFVIVAGMLAFAFLSTMGFSAKLLALLTLASLALL